MTTTDVHRHLLLDEEFRRRLTRDVEQAAEQGRPYAVIAAQPGHLPGEDLSEAVAIAGKLIDELKRDDDLAGRLDGEMIVVGLRNTDLTAARIFGHRLQGDLYLRLQARGLATVWEAGAAVLSQDGDTADELIEAAIHAVKTYRRRLAML